MNEGNTGWVATARLGAYQEIAHESNYVSFSLHKLYFPCFTEPTKISELLKN